MRSKIERAFPNSANDPHLAVANRASGLNTNLNTLVDKALGIGVHEFHAFTPLEIRLSHWEARNRDLANHRYVPIDGYIVTNAESALRQLIDRVMGA